MTARQIEQVICPGCRRPMLKDINPGNWSIQ